MAECPLCSSKKGVKHTCEVCKRQFCRSCCKRYLALETDPVTQLLNCNECFLEHVAWDSSRTYDVLGPETADKTVVLVHGALIGRHCLVLEARALAEAGFRVLLPDLPAHGARFKEEPLTLDNAVTTLHDVITKEVQPGHKVVMMGFSMGGYVAAAFAAKHPDLVAGVVMGACAHDAHTTTWKLVGYLSQAVYAVCSPKTKSQFIYKSLNGPDYMRPQRVEIQECFLRTGAEMDSWKYAWKVMYDANMHKLLPKITCPALVVVGEKDFRSHEKVWLSLLKHGRLLVLKDGIHQFMFQPGAVTEFRQQAYSFTTEAFLGSSADTGSEVVQYSAGGEATVSASAAAAKSGESVAADEVTVSAPRSVGIGVVVESVLAQFKPEKKQRPQDSKDGGPLIGAGKDSSVAC